MDMRIYTTWCDVRSFCVYTSLRLLKWNGGSGQARDFPMRDTYPDCGTVNGSGSHNSTIVNEEVVFHLRLCLRPVSSTERAMLPTLVSGDLYNFLAGCCTIEQASQVEKHMA
jgi:hypothetical protein